MSAAVQEQLIGMDPFNIEIGSARASGSAAAVEIWPQAGPAELNHRVGAGLLAAGMDLPPEETPLWAGVLQRRCRPTRRRSPR
ncbi:hypothetical protein ACWDYJ_21810 [Streptomyces sp. NPDC003042]